MHYRSMADEKRRISVPGRAFVDNIGRFRSTDDGSVGCAVAVGSYSLSLADAMVQYGCMVRGRQPVLSMLKPR